MSRLSHHLDPLQTAQQKLRNTGKTSALLAAKVLVLASVAWLIAGASGLIWALIATAAALAFVPRLGPAVVLRMHGARPLLPHEAPEARALTRQLALRAGLPSVPPLFYVPSPAPLAFTVGSRHSAAIALSDGILVSLSPRELQGVLAHEISHVRNADLGVMHVAGVLGTVTRWLSIGGLVMLTLSLPLLGAGGAFPFVAGWVLMIAPVGVDLLQLALSRAREYDADLDAAALTGDPRGLAAALRKLEMLEGGLLWMLRGVAPPAVAPWLRSHPPTTSRIERLLNLAPRVSRSGYRTIPVS